MSRSAAPETRLLIVGRGKVAHGIRRAYNAHVGAGLCRMRALADVRDRDLAWAEVALLAVPDGAIRDTATALSVRIRDELVVLHLSGNRSPEEASACTEHGALHPFASFASSSKPPSLEGVYFAVAGTPLAVRAAGRIARACGGHLLTEARGRRHASLQGSAYHASAALVANGTAALASTGVDILARLGVSPNQARQAVASLLRSVAENVERVGVPDALTGPIMRGDADTVRAHRAALDELGGAALAAYDHVGPAVLLCAREAGLEEPAAKRVARLFQRGRRRH